MPAPSLPEALSRGALPARALQEQLGVSSATLSRHARGTSGVLRFGRARRTTYGLAAPIRDLPARLPLFRVTEDGEVEEHGVLSTLANEQIVHELAGDFTIFDGLPPFLVDMVPQGFLGRRFPARHADLELPGRIVDWSTPHCLYALAKRGEDLLGDLVVGDESLDRFFQLRHEARRPSRALADAAASGGVGSSAGGEQPKFTLFDGEQHEIVKFADTTTPAGQRWRDLLLCEELALSTLRDAGVDAAEARFSESDDIAFLAAPRFDRVGVTGRRSVVSLLAVDSFRYGELDRWSSSTARLVGDGLLPEEDHMVVLLLETFSELIGNTDRHFGNLSLLCPERSGYAPYRLAPAYDVVPMLYAPIETNPRPSPTRGEVPRSSTNREIYERAAALADDLSARLTADPRISDDFKAVWARG